MVFHKRIPQKNENVGCGEVNCALKCRWKESIISTITLQLTVQFNAWFTPSSFVDFCRFKLCSILVILSHIVSDFGLVIRVDFFEELVI